MDKGDRHGALTAIKYVGVRGGFKWWLFACDCGVEKEIRAASVSYGTTTSCGCRRHSIQRHLKHGLSKHPLYITWYAMIDRCNNPNHKSYPRYGGRGITVCERWLKFENFLADMGERPEGMSLDRTDNNKGYEPGNCRWATMLQQQLNTSRTRVYEIDGRKNSISGWAREYGVRQSSLSRLLNSGLSIEDSIRRLKCN